VKLTGYPPGFFKSKVYRAGFILKMRSVKNAGKIRVSVNRNFACLVSQPPVSFVKTADFVKIAVSAAENRISVKTAVNTRVFARAAHGAA